MITRPLTDIQVIREQVELDSEDVLASLSPEAKKLVEKYRFLNRELDRYQGSVFYTGNPNDARCKKYEAEQKEISDKLSRLGYNIDACY